MSLCIEPIQALIYAAEQFEINLDAGQLIHQAGGVCEFDTSVLSRLALWSGLEVRETEVDADRLAHLSPFCLLPTRSGWKVFVQYSEGKVSVYDPKSLSLTELSVQSLVAEWDGTALLLRLPRQLRKPVRFGLSWFVPSVIKHSQQFKWVIVVSIMVQLIPLVAPVLMENVIDKVLVSRSLNSLEVLGIAIVALAVFEPLFSYLRSWIFSHLISKVNSELMSRLFSHLIRLPLQYFQARQTGEIIARVKEMDQIRQFLTGSALTLILDLAFVLVFLGVMLAYSAELTLVVVVSLFIYFVFWLSIGPGIRARVTREYEVGADNTAFLAETITGIETVKTTATEHRFDHAWQRHLSQYNRALIRARILGIAAGQGIGLVQKLTSVLLLWWGVNQVLKGELTPGELVAFNMLSGHVTQPILRLAQIWQDFQHTLISLRRIGDILDEETENAAQGLASVPGVSGEVEFEQVRFRYSADAPEVLKNTSLTIAPGEFVGITGPSGCGKSTLTRLLQRLYVPDSGKVSVDGMDLAIADPVSLRRNMSVVLQQSVLFSGTVAENITISHPHATQAEIEAAAQLAGAHSFITQLAQGYETQVGEKGARLSGGQRQRIALARALITQPKILIMDEATSALDYESEAAILANMASISHGRTLISIAHRLNTLRHADRILVMDKGQIIEHGSHTHLLQLGGVYARLWQEQQS